jgi:hypothetical protein
MSPDSVVPNPNDTYSYDRYAYCRNNPVNLTDPSGHLFGVDDALAALIVAALITAGATFVSTLVSGGTVGEAFENAAIAGGSVFLFGVYAGPVVSAVIQANMHGGNLLQAALIAGISMAIGVGVGNAIAANVPAAYQGVVNVLASGMVGGAISSAMGGDFWQGFTSAAVAAGVSLAANAVAGEIEKGTAEGGEGATSVLPQATKTTGANPVDSLPPASELPPEQQELNIYKFGDNRFTNRATAAVQKAAEAKGYSTHVIKIRDVADFEQAYSTEVAKGRLTGVVVSHYRAGGPNEGFFIPRHAGQLSPSKMASIVVQADPGIGLLNLGTRVYFVGCNTAFAANYSAILSNQTIQSGGVYGHLSATYDQFYFDYLKYPNAAGILYEPR